MDDVVVATDEDLARAGVKPAHREKFLRGAAELTKLKFQDCDGDTIVFQLATSGDELQQVINGGNPKVRPCPHALQPHHTTGSRESQ